MAKETFYFSHDYNARNDDKILELRAKYGSEGYGIFWMIIESMAENEDGGLKASLLAGLSIGFGTTKEFLTDLMEFSISISLFYKEDNKYFSKRLLGHKEFRKFLSDKGKEGVMIRENKKHGFKGGLNGASSYPLSKERKGKEINGISFNEEKNAVILSDGTIQKLGEGQLRRIVFNDIMPEEITKGYIV